MTKKAKAPIEDLFVHRHDSREWDERAEPIEVRASPSSVLSIRMPSAELIALSEAAANAGETMSQYTRKAVYMRVMGLSITTVSLAFTGTLIAPNAAPWTEAAPSNATLSSPIPANA